MVPFCWFLLMFCFLLLFLLCFLLCFACCSVVFPFVPFFPLFFNVGWQGLGSLNQRDQLPGAGGCPRDAALRWRGGGDKSPRRGGRRAGATFGGHRGPGHKIRQEGQTRAFGTKRQPCGCGSELNDRRGKPQVLEFHVSTYQGSMLEFRFFSWAIGQRAFGHQTTAMCVAQNATIGGANRRFWNSMFPLRATHVGIPFFLMGHRSEGLWAPSDSHVWLRMQRSEGQTAGFGIPCFHLPGFHVGIPVF